MELRHLRYFIAAAEEEHFGRASERLHVTRPAVSQTVADLERELGTALFERLAQRARLTAAGQALLPDLRAVMSQLDQALGHARQIGQGKTGHLKIGYGSLTLLHSLFRRAIKQYREHFPDVTLSLVEIPSSEHPQALANGRIDAGFMHFGPRQAASPRVRGKLALPPSETALDSYRIQVNGLGVAVAHDHPLARKKSVTLAELAGARFVVVPRSTSSPSYGHLFGLCQAAGFEPQVAQEVSSITSQLNLVSVGVGIGLVVIGPHFSYPDTLAVVPLQGVDYATQFAFVWAKHRRDPTLERMIETVKSLSRKK